MYNQFIATRSRSRKQKEDSGATAGAGKVPRVGVNKSDLEAQGAQHGWTARPLTHKEVLAMSSSELRWHEQFNPENLEKVFAAEEHKRGNTQNMAGSNNKRMWSGKATEEESQKAYAAGDRFALNYSQFVRNAYNSEAMVLYMAENNLDATVVGSYIEAFEVLAPQGKLVLSPKSAGIGSEETLTGEALKKYPRLHLLCQPNKVLKPEDKLSADQWFAAHPELHETRIPDTIVQGWNKVMQTFVAGHPEFVDTTEAREKLFAALKSKNMNVTPQAIEEVFNDLAKNGEVQIDNSKTVRGQAVRLVNLGGRR
jgi:hypothetical protein